MSRCEFLRPSSSGEPTPGFVPESNEDEDGTEETKEKSGIFELEQTEIPGVSLRVEPGVKLSLLKKSVRRLLKLARQYAKRDSQIKALQKKQKEPSKEIKEIAKTNTGLRGVESEQDNLILTVTPRRSVKYEYKALRETLGAVTAPTIIHDSLVISIEIPPGFQTAEGQLTGELLKTTLMESLKSLGLKEEDLRKLTEWKDAHRVDEEALEEMEADGKVELSPGTRKIITTWAIDVEPLEKQQKQSKRRES